MGIFGRSRADEALITSQKLVIDRQSEIIGEGHYRNPGNGRLGAKGVLPEHLKF